MGRDDAEPVEIPRQAYTELKTLRQMGTHDMESGEVLDGLEAYNFESARRWVLDNPDAYMRLLYETLRDETPTETFRDEPPSEDEA